MDQFKRNRQRTGGAVLSEAIVAGIKQRLFSGISSVREEAQIYGVAMETIRKIWRGETWAWVEAGAAIEPPDHAAAQASFERLEKMLNEASDVKKLDSELEELKK